MYSPVMICWPDLWCKLCIKMVCNIVYGIKVLYMKQSLLYFRQIDVSATAESIHINDTLSTISLKFLPIYTSPIVIQNCAILPYKYSFEFDCFLWIQVQTFCIECKKYLLMLFISEMTGFMVFVLVTFHNIINLQFNLLICASYISTIFFAVFIRISLLKLVEKKYFKLSFFYLFFWQV